MTYPPEKTLLSDLFININNISQQNRDNLTAYPGYAAATPNQMRDAILSIQINVNLVGITDGQPVSNIFSQGTTNYLNILIELFRYINGSPYINRHLSEPQVANQITDISIYSPYTTYCINLLRVNPNNGRRYINQTIEQLQNQLNPKLFLVALIYLFQFDNIYCRLGNTMVQPGTTRATPITQRNGTALDQESIYLILANPVAFPYPQYDNLYTGAPADIMEESL
jgi:hypothetical protein